jgi:hypothetical protein
MKLILKSEIKYLRRFKCCSPCRIRVHWDRLLAQHSDYRMAIIPQILHVLLIYLPSTRSSPDISSAANFAYNPDKKRVLCYTSEYRQTALVINRVPYATTFNCITIPPTPFLILVLLLERKHLGPTNPSWTTPSIITFFSTDLQTK